MSAFASAAAPVAIVPCKDHYDSHLALHYSWMFRSPYEDMVAQQRTLLLDSGVPLITPSDPSSRPIAVDLGCGSGFQSLALASMDLCKPLLDELNAHVSSHNARLSESSAALPPEDDPEHDEFEPPVDGDVQSPAGPLASWEESLWSVETHHADMTTFPALLNGRHPVVIVCMGDTLTHLPDRAALRRLLADCAAALSKKRKRGQKEQKKALVLRFRDLANSPELLGLDRYFEVARSEGRVMKCFLQWESADYLVVHDLFHVRQDIASTLGIDEAGAVVTPGSAAVPGSSVPARPGWIHTASAYRKLRIDPAQIGRSLEGHGMVARVDVAKGWMATVVGDVRDDAESEDEGTDYDA